MRQVLNVPLWIWTEDESGKYPWTKTAVAFFFHCLICFFAAQDWSLVIFNTLIHDSVVLELLVQIAFDHSLLHEDEVVNEILGIKFWIKLCRFVLEILQSFFLYSSCTLKVVINIMASLLTHGCIKSPTKDGRRTLSHLKMKYREFVPFILFWGAVGSTQEPDPDLHQCNLVRATDLDIWKSFCPIWNGEFFQCLSISSPKLCC